MNFDIEAKAKEVVEALGGTVEVVKGTMVAWHQSPAITKVILPNGIEFSFWPSNHYFAWELEVEGKKHMFYSHPYDGADKEELDKLEDTIRQLASRVMAKVILAPTLEEAQKVESPVATVEAEYGGAVIEGTEVTLAHHVEAYRGNPAPCITEVEPIQGGTILVSHLDLDTLGGIAALTGQKPEHSGFWRAAEFIDLHGPHRIMEVDEELRPLFRAYWAYSAQNRLPRFTEATDVTEIVQAHLDVIRRIIDGDEELIEDGKRWAEELEQKQEDALMEEDDLCRVFVTQNTPTAAAYYSPSLGKVIPATISYNLRFGAITVACEGGQFDARSIVQKLWGPEAGGHPGIAGSPRGKRMAAADLARAVEAVREALK